MMDGASISSRGKSIWPNLFIVGAAKAGTTSLYMYLSQHPDIFMSPVKEPHYFSGIQTDERRKHLSRVITDEREYLKLFEKGREYKVIGEASTSYLHHARTAAPNILSSVPKAKIIVVLRDPIERAYSHYLMDVRSGVEERSFVESIKEDFFDEWKPGVGGALYVEMGMYFSQVKTYLDLFGEENVRILLFDQLKRDRERVLQEVSEFLDIDFSPFKAIRHDLEYNTYAVPRSFWVKKIMTLPLTHYLKSFLPPSARLYLRHLFFRKAPKPKIDEEAFRMLRAVYARDVSLLEELLDKPLPELRRTWK